MKPNIDDVFEVPCRLRADNSQRLAGILGGIVLSWIWRIGDLRSTEVGKQA